MFSLFRRYSTFSSPLSLFPHLSPPLFFPCLLSSLFLFCLPNLYVFSPVHVSQPPLLFSLTSCRLLYLFFFPSVLVSFPPLFISPFLLSSFSSSIFLPVSPASSSLSPLFSRLSSSQFSFHILPSHTTLLLVSLSPFLISSAPFPQSLSSSSSQLFSNILSPNLFFPSPVFFSVRSPIFASFISRYLLIFFPFSSFLLSCCLILFCFHLVSYICTISTDM